jgi:hypothetical protein
MGNATSAPTGPFHAERVHESHHAMGVPISRRITVTTVASFTVSQIADKSEALKMGSMEVQAV